MDLGHSPDTGASEGELRPPRILKTSLFLQKGGPRKEPSQRTATALFYLIPCGDFQLSPQEFYLSLISRPLDDLEVVYLWVDGVYVKAGLEKEKAVLLVVLAALSDGSKAVVSVTSGYRESTQSWSEVLRDLKQRGMGCPRLVIGDGHLGIWGALRNVYPQAEEQRCWNHRIVNLLAKLPKGVHKPALLILRQIPYAETREEAQRLKQVFQHWCRQRGLTQAAELIEQDWDRMVTFYNYPKKQWQHLRTTNPVESPFAALRLRTDAAKRFKKVENAQALIWKMLLVAEKRFRRLKAPELMKDVYQGAEYVNGVLVNQVPEEKAA